MRIKENRKANLPCKRIGKPRMGKSGNKSTGAMNWI
jgi:hypothetical protein